MGLDAEVAVVGLGAMGSAALWRLAARGVDVIGFEQFPLGHDQGSSHGETRLFRTLCLEHPALVTVARTSHQLLRELEAGSGEELLTISGGLMLGAPDSTVIRGVRAAANAAGAPLETMSAAEVRERFPQHHDLDPTHVGLWDPDAGVVRPEASIVAAAGAARAAGARVVDRTAVTDISFADDAVHVRTNDHEFRAGRVIVSTGAWLAKMVPGLPLRPIRTPMTWFDPVEPSTDYDLARFPVFIREIDEQRVTWGHGAVFGHPVKIGPEDDPNYRQVDADRVDRTIGERDWAHVGQLVARFLPGLRPVPTRITTCMITRSPDMQFQLGPLAVEPRLIAAGGDSGHAFKHATGIGEYLAQLAVGERPYVDLGFTDPNRFTPAGRRTSPGPGSP